MASYNPIPWLMTRQTINFLDTIEKWKERKEKGNITINSFLQDSRQSIKYSNVNWLKESVVVVERPLDVIDRQTRPSN